MIIKLAIIVVLLAALNGAAATKHLRGDKVNNFLWKFGQQTDADNLERVKTSLKKKVKKSMKQAVALNPELQEQMNAAQDEAKQTVLAPAEAGKDGFRQHLKKTRPGDLTAAVVLNKKLSADPELAEQVKAARGLDEDTQIVTPEAVMAEVVQHLKETHPEELKAAVMQAHADEIKAKAMETHGDDIKAKVVEAHGDEIKAKAMETHGDEIKAKAMETHADEIKAEG